MYGNVQEGEPLTAQIVIDTFKQLRSGIPLDIVFEDAKYDIGRKVRTDRTGINWI